MLMKEKEEEEIPEEPNVFRTVVNVNTIFAQMSATKGSVNLACKLLQP